MRFFLFLLTLSCMATIQSNIQNDLTHLAKALQQLKLATPKKKAAKPPIDLGWCGCFSKTTRMEYAEGLAQDIAKTFNAKEFTEKAPFVHVSIASGSLLQDLRILKKLIRDHHFNHLHVYIIDCGYPSCCSDVKELDEKKHTRYLELFHSPLIKKYKELDILHDKVGETGTQQEQEAAQQAVSEFYTHNEPLIQEYNDLEEEVVSNEEMIPLFQGLLASLMPKDGTVEVTYLSVISNYITRTLQNSHLKPHSISLTDPDYGCIESNETPSEANIIKISNRFYFTKPYNQLGKLWDAKNNDDEERKKIIALLAPYKTNSTVLITHVKQVLDDASINNNLYSSVFMAMQYLIGKTMRPKTIYHRLYDDFDTEKIVRPFKVENLNQFLLSDQVTPFLKYHATYAMHEASDDIDTEPTDPEKESKLIDLIPLW